jgi:4-amino-4-deoxy-L-arabinose transferase-like glycosyltransferase
LLRQRQEAYAIDTHSLIDLHDECPNQIMRQRVPLIALLLVSLLASALVIYTTHWGAWAGSDSAAYLATARSLASGNGFQVLKPSGEAAILMPPLYPLLLAGLNLVGISLLESARWLGVVLFGLTILVIGLSFLRLSNSAWLAVPVGALLLSFPVMLRSYSGIMSEAPFLVLTLAGLFLLGNYLSNGSHPWLVGAAITCALAALTRFIGAALLPVALVLLLLLRPTPLKRRLGDIVIFSLIFAIPTFTWLVWYAQHAPAAIEIARWDDLWEYLTPVRAGLVNVLWEWLPFQETLPVHRYLYKLATLVLLTTGIFGGTVWVGFRLHARDLRKWIADRDMRLFTICALFVILYLLVFTLIYLFRYPPQDVDERTLLPLFPAFVVMIFSMASLIICSAPTDRLQRWLSSLPWLLLVLGLSTYLPKSLAMADQIHRTGEGYTHAAWRASQTTRALQELPPDITIISNDTGAILFFTGRMAIEISETNRSEPLRQFIRFGDDLDDSAQALFREGETALVLFYPSFYWQLHELYQDDTERRLEAFVQGLVAYGEFQDGAIYFYPAEQ